MFCYQCEQTSAGTGCTVVGVCGKNKETSDLQDLTLYLAEGISSIAHALRAKGVKDNALDRSVVEALFTTVTNVNFDPVRLRAIIAKQGALKKEALVKLQATGADITKLPAAANFNPASDPEELLVQARTVSILKRKQELGADVTGLQELLMYGLKGAAAYADHAAILGHEDDAVYAYFHEALAYLATNPTDVGELTAACLKCGEVNLRVMELLDAANTGAYGHPEPTQVKITATVGKAILVSGHDLKDLEELLKQTAGKGINIYTHGEMLPALAYPGLKKYPHLVGNYGGAWQDQGKEFAAFPGAILMTTNCIQKPRESYNARIFTCGLVAWPGVTHIADRNFAPVIDAALAAEGFAATEEEKTITIGFGRNAVLSVAGTVIDAVKAGAIKHFFLVGGCDGAKSGRNYYTDLAQQIPQDCVILTLACGKYRFNKLEFGDIGGIPRLLDIGQCNDAYSAIKIALALADAFEVGVNDLPLSLILSWYEQKAVVILLTLLHLGIKGIRLGPTLPAFITPAVLNVLVENFAIAPVTTAEQDLKAILG
ncbi:MAG: hydroxylamine reductase [Kiritimatiellae bacterium]|nr:hydroxylamine reductase [Kiritimatiellia bacterium]